MQNVIIVGAGQLGSRHLQSLGSLPYLKQILVVDPSEQSLKVAQERFQAAKTEFNGDVQFVQNIPKGCSFDFGVIATNAGERCQAIKTLITMNQIKNILFEKILFADAKDYFEIAELLSAQKINAWVNCTMRQMDIYQQIKNEIASDQFHMSVSGSGFGLVTNAIHYIDYACWLAGSSSFTLYTHGLDNSPIQSKRAGYLEFNGTMSVVFENGSTVSLTCFKNGQLPVVVEVHTPNSRYLVRESEGITNKWSSSVGTESKWTELVSKIPFQSQLTAKLVEQIRSGETLYLTTFAEGKNIHLNMLNPLKKFIHDNHMEKHLEMLQVRPFEFPFT